MKEFGYIRTERVIRLARYAALAAAFVVAGCGGGGGDAGTPVATQPPVTPPPETLFVPANAWNGARPAGAEMVSADEFRRRQVAGEIQVTTVATQESLRTTNRRTFESERDFLESRTDTTDAVKALLARSRTTDLDSSPDQVLPDGQRVKLIDVGSSVIKAAESYRLAHSAENALATYRLSYALLDNEQKAQATAPATLQSASLAQIQDAAEQLNGLLIGSDDLDKTHLDPAANASSIADRKAAAGALEKLDKETNSRDNDGECAPTGYVTRYSFPLRNFVSPVKQQGARGVCWAFAAIAALESRERVQNNYAVDLSEQFLVNKVKHEWSPNDFLDGFQSATALHQALVAQQLIPRENQWLFNQAQGRPANAGAAGIFGTSAAYVGACIDFKDSRRCSETAHQAERICSIALGVEYCAFVNAAFDGPGVPSNRVNQIWSHGQPFNVETYRNYLASGVSIIASFPVYVGFVEAANGIVADYRVQSRNAAGMLVNGADGSHVAQIVGFISNEQLSFPGFPPANVLGGGYFILRNSWGCTAGDGGYYYVPAKYVGDLFTSLDVLEMDARRSARWNEELITPGGASGLAVVPNGITTVDLRVRTNIANTISVQHPTANYARLTVTSNLDGVLYDGQWMINPPVGGSLFANSLWVNFPTADDRVLTVTARYGTQVVTGRKDIIVKNTRPAIELQSSGNPQQGENYVINAVVTDLNEVDPAGICASMSWNVTAPDTFVSGVGCARIIRFGTTGSRAVSVIARDREGLEASRLSYFDVAPPPGNPYPRIASFGVYSRDSKFAGGIFLGCEFNRRSDDEKIDLRAFGCKTGVADPALYSSQVTVENPSGERLTYEWTYTDYYPSALLAPRVSTISTNSPTFEMNGFVFTPLNTPNPPTSRHRCTVDVRVNAPQASRSKTLRVWSGECTNYDSPVR